MKARQSNHPNFNGFLGWWFGTVKGTLTPDEYELIKNKYKNDENKDTQNQ